MPRGKTLVASQTAQVMRDGVGMVSSLLLKDNADHTAFKVFEPDGTKGLPGFEFGANVPLVADPASFKQLPWADKTGWVQCQSYFTDSQPVVFDTRHVLQTALAQLADAGYRMTCGLEIEFHIYKIKPDGLKGGLDPQQADWPGPAAPDVSMIHPGYHLLSEQSMDMAEESMRIVQRTAQALGSPLLSLEIELSPSQVEAVFEATDALSAADNMVLFRSDIKQALRRAGCHATFMCRPPFPHIMSSGWHLHQSLVKLATGANVFMRPAQAPHMTPLDAQYTLSAAGEHYLAGLLAHARSMTAFCTPHHQGLRALQTQRAVTAVGAVGP